MATDETPDGRDDEHAVQLEAGPARLTILPDLGCRVGSLTVGGVELLRQGPNFGSFPMVPWCGRTRDGQFRNGGVLHQMPRDAGPHAIHGTGRHVAWHTAPGATGGSACFYYDLAEPWPYKGRVSQRFELSEDRLDLTMSVETTDDSFPAQAGFGTPGSCAISAGAGRTPRSTSPPAGWRSAATTTCPPAAGWSRSPAPGTTASACRTVWTSP